MIVRHLNLLRRRGAAALAGVVIAAPLAACSGADSTSASDTTDGGSSTSSCAKTSQPFSTDDAEDAIEYEQLDAELGAFEAPSDVQLGSVMKFLGNQYWTSLSEGQTEQAEKHGVELEVQAAATESDQLGQLNAAQTMLQAGYDALLVSPQSDANLCPAVERAEQSDVLVVNVNDAVLPNAQQWVGPNQIQNGVSAAEYLIEELPEGSEVAVIQGQAGVYAARQRTKGFTETAEEGGLKVVASVPGDWDVQKARDAAATIIEGNPEVKAFYANNDTMALGVAEAVNAAGKNGEIMVIGTDGISDAYEAIRAGDMTATVDSYPVLTGQVAVEVALRLLAGQDVPRAVYTPQALITSANVDDAPPSLD